MKNKKLKLLLSVLITVMLASLLAGCGSKEENEGTPSNSPNSPTKDTTKLSDEPVELSVFSYEFDGVAAEDSLIYNTIKDKLNIKLKPVSASWNDWEEKLNIMIASGEMPDIFFSYGIDRPVQYQQWIKEGMLLPISDYMSEYPNIERPLKSFEVLAKATGGKHYSFPILNSLDVDKKQASSGHNILIRKDWLDNLKLGVPTTIDEFYNVLKQFKENDPDDNNKNDTYGYTSSGGGVWWQYPIFNAFGTSVERWKKNGDTWEPELLSDNTGEALQFLNKLYKEKIMDPEFMINTDDQKIEKFITGKVGVIVHNANANFYNDLYEKFGKAYPGADPESMFTWVGTLKGKDGVQRMDGFNTFWGVTSIKAGLSEEKRSKALELLDYLLSEEGQNLLINGIEGTHYKKEGDKIVPLLTKEEKEKDKGFKLKSLVSWNVDIIPDDTPNRENIIALDKSTADHAVPNPLAFLSISEDALDPNLSAQVNDFANEQIVNMIVNSNDVPGDFEKFKQNWLAKGGDKIIEETSKHANAEGR